MKDSFNDYNDKNDKDKDLNVIKSTVVQTLRCN